MDTGHKKKEYAMELVHLTKSYGRRRGVTDLSLTVEEGDIFGFLGPNGAGKSTTIRSLLGMLSFSEGEARILGMDVRRQHKEVLREVGYMPSEAMFYPDMRVKDVIAFAADMHRKDCRKEASMLCERLEVDVEKRIRELSLGNRKKVSIVCAMQHRPRLFVLDEPTSGLDPLMQKEFFGLIREYCRAGATCFLSSHVLSEIKSYCNRAAIIREGRLVRVDTVENLTRANGKNIRLVRDGVEESFMFKGDFNQLFAGFAGHDIADILIEEPRLEDIFMHYYEEGEQ